MAGNRYYSSPALAATLSSSMTNSQTTCVITSSPTSLNWPSSYPYSILVDWGTTSAEVMSVSAVSGTGPYTLTVTRGIDGTTAVAHTAQSYNTVFHGFSGQDIGEVQYHMNATGPTTYPNTGGTDNVAVHGLGSGSAVVGTTDTQTLTNKTLGSGTVLPSSVANKYTGTVPSGSTSATITHNLGNQYPAFAVYEVSTGIYVDVDGVGTSTSVLTLTFAVAPTSGQYIITVIG